MSRREDVPVNGKGTFHSILFAGVAGSAKEETPRAPEFLGDLNLDQIIDAITAGKEEYNLKPFFQQDERDRRQPDATVLVAVQ